MNEIKLTYMPCQKVYVTEFDKELNRYVVHEQIISHVDVCNGQIKSYTSSDDGFTDDICIYESWTGLVSYARQKSPEHNPVCMRGKVFPNKRDAKKYQSKMNKSIVL